MLDTFTYPSQNAVVQQRLGARDVLSLARRHTVLCRAEGGREEFQRVGTRGAVWWIVWKLLNAFGFMFIHLRCNTIIFRRQSFFSWTRIVPALAKQIRSEGNNLGGIRRSTKYDCRNEDIYQTYCRKSPLLKQPRPQKSTLNARAPHG